MSFIDSMILFMKEYVGLFLIFTVVLYLLPAEHYQGYVRFFLEMVLLLFCMQQFLQIGNQDLWYAWETSYDSFWEEMERIEQEAKSMDYVDMGYVKIYEGEE